MAEEPGDGDRVPDERDDEQAEEPSVSSEHTDQSDAEIESEVESEVDPELTADETGTDPTSDDDTAPDADDEPGADEGAPPGSHRPYHESSRNDHTGDEAGGANGADADGPDDAVEPSTDRMLPEDDDAGAGAQETRDDDDVSKPDVDDVTNETGVSEAPPGANGVAGDDDANGVSGENTAAEKRAETAARTDGSHAGSDVGVAGTGSVADETPGDSSSEVGISQPPDDEEMPLADHVEEMINRLAIVLFAASVVTVVAFPVAERLITTVWFGVLPAQDVASPHVYGPLELKLTELKLASLAGLTVALPVAVYETYLFMRPGLYPNERRYYLAAVPTSLVLAVVGISFAYFLVLPGLFTYFLYYSDVTANVAFGLRETFNLILTMMGMLAVVFQIPLFIMLATMMGITSRQWLADNRLLFWGAFLGLAFLFSPDPTGMAPLIVAVTMVTLYEGTLLLLRWVGR